MDVEVEADWCYKVGVVAYDLVLPLMWLWRRLLRIDVSGEVERRHSNNRRVAFVNPHAVRSCSTTSSTTAAWSSQIDGKPFYHRRFAY